MGVGQGETGNLKPLQDTENRSKAPRGSPDAIQEGSEGLAMAGLLEAEAIKIARREARRWQPLGLALTS